MKAQLTELLTNYGEIGGIWFDGEWDQIKWDGKRFGTKIMDFKFLELDNGIKIFSMYFLNKP